MKNKFLLSLLFVCVLCLMTATSISAQNCVGGAEVTAPAGGSVAATSALTVYNSTEAGADSAAARTSVDAQDNAWRAAVTAANLGTTFNFWNDTTTAQQNVSVPVATAFTLSGVGVGLDLRDFPANYRSVTAPCTGSAIATTAEKFGVYSKVNTLQTSQNSPRPASLYNATSQPLAFDELEFSSQPNRNTSTVNAVIFTFSKAIKAFGTWIGDIETRTDGVGQPIIVRFLDASGNRIGSDVRIEPMSGSQAACGGSAVGCGNQTTRWIGFTDTNTAARVRQVVLITGVQDDTSGLSNQRISFVGPTIPLAVTTAASASVSGRVLTYKNYGIGSVLISLTDSSGTTRTTLTGKSGYYRFDDVPVGDTYVIEARNKRYQFGNSVQVLNINEDLPEVNFKALLYSL